MLHFNTSFTPSVKAAPSHYLCQAGIGTQAGEHIKPYGDRVLIIGGRRALAAMGEAFLSSLRRAGLAYEIHVFTTEVCEEEIQKICAIGEAFKPQVVVGVGGGKALDTAKLSAYAMDIPMVCVPTIAATCSAVTPLSVLYNQNGTYRQDAFLRRNPDLVLLDPQVIADAPVQYLKSGALDAIAKWYEGSASIQGCSGIADIFDECALEIAHMLFEKMNRNVEAAVTAAVEHRLNTELLEVIHLNLYFAGMIQSVGIKAVRNGIAHSVHNGLTLLPESHALLHGLKVGYGIYVQLTVLGQQKDMLDQALDFFRRLQFMPSFAALGLPFTEQTVRTVAEKTHADPMMRKIPFNTITREDLVDAMYRIENAAARQATVE